MSTVDLNFQKRYIYSPVSQQFGSGGKNCEQIVKECTDSAPAIGARHGQIALYFLLGFIAFAFRVSLSVGIVAMMDPTVSSNPNVPTYPHWKNKNIILSSFFWGYVVLQFFAAWVAKKYGAKWFLVGAMFIQSCLSILTPVTVATFDEKGMMVSRALEGLCQGFVFPSCTHLLSQWLPPQERSRFGSVIFTSGKLGTLCAMFVTGIVAASSYGWPLASRGVGALGLLWCILMAIFGYNRPKDHPSISVAERLYIEKSLGHDDKHHKTPYKAIITSPPVWALFAAQSGQNYAFWTLLTQMPSYMNYVMKFNMKDNGLWSAVPYLVMFILSYVFGFISDMLINKDIISRGVARKIFNSIGFFIPAAALVVLGYTNSGQTTQAVTMSIIAIGISAACYSGFAVNHMDLSPNHAGIIFGLFNGLTQLTAVIAPLAVQVWVKDETDPTQWRIVFLISAGCYTISAIIFIIFGSGKVQWWNKEEDTEKA